MNILFTQDEKIRGKKDLEKCKDISDAISSYYFEISFYLEQIKLFNINSLEQENSENISCLIQEISNCLAEVKHEIDPDMEVKSCFATVESLLYKVNQTAKQLLYKYEKVKLKAANTNAIDVGCRG